MHIWGAVRTLNTLTGTLYLCLSVLLKQISQWTHRRSSHKLSAMFICYFSILYTLLYHTIYLWSAVIHRLAPTYSTCTFVWKLCACAWTWNADVVVSSHHNLRRVFGYTKKRPLKEYSWFKIGSALLTASLARCQFPQSVILSQPVVMLLKWKSMGQGNLRTKKCSLYLCL